MHSLLLLESMRVLVTGGAGFIGTHLCRALLALGADVHGVSRRSASRLGIKWWTADLADSEATDHVMNAVKPNVVFHLASHVNGSRDLDAVTPTFSNNLASTVNVLTAATRVDTQRVLLAGSMEENDTDAHEETPSSPYAAAKTASAEYGRMFHALYGLPVVNLKTYMTYGPGQQDGSKLIPYVTNSLLNGEQPRLGSGTREVDWVYVGDVVDGYLAAAVAEGVAGRSVAIGSGELASIRSVVDQLVELTGSEVQPHFGALPDRPMDRVRGVADVAHTRDSIGWEPSVSLREGLARTVAWYREQARASVCAT